MLVCMTVKQIKEMIEVANELGFSPKEYVFLYYTLVPDDFTYRPWGDLTNVSNPTKTKSSFDSLLQLTLSSMAGSTVDEFLKKVAYESSKAPFFKTLYMKKNYTVSGYSLFSYEVTYLLCEVLNRTISEGRSVRDINWMMNITKNRQFTTKFGNLTIDSNGDRLPSYWLWVNDKKSSSYIHWLNIALKENDVNSPKVTAKFKRIWPTENGMPPPAVPKCGFKNELCPKTSKGN